MWGSVDGAIVGCDFSGSIVKLGSGLKNPSLKVGDRVATAIHGGKFKDKVRGVKRTFFWNHC
jgi:NADPH:quinone reductase-like Zn-dependent oxidoreductase